MLRQELLYTTQDTVLPMRRQLCEQVLQNRLEPASALAVRKGEETTSQSNKLFSLQSLILTPPLLTQHNYSTLLPGVCDLSRVNITFT